MVHLPSNPTQRRPVLGPEVRIESVGVYAPNRHRVDVAVDLTPSLDGIRLEIAVEEPSGAELVSMTLVDNRDRMVDRRLHLRRAPEPGVHVLHVGIFYQDELIHHVRQEFDFPEPGSAGSTEEPR